MLFDYRLEVEIAADRISLEKDAYMLVATGEHLAIAQDTVA